MIKIKLPTPPKIKSTKIVNLFDNLGCEFSNEESKPLRFKTSEEILKQFFNTNNELTKSEINIIWSNLISGLESEEIFNHLLIKYFNNNSENSANKIVDSFTQSKLLLLFLDTLFILDNSNTNKYYISLKSYIFSDKDNIYNQISNIHNRYIDLETILEELGHSCYINKQTPMNKTNDFSFLLIDKTRTIIEIKIEEYFFETYYLKLSEKIKRLQKDNWYLNYFITVEENGIAQKKVVNRLERLLVLCNSHEDLKIIIPLISGKLTKLQGTARIVDVFPGLSNNALKIIKQFSKETQYQIFYKIAKILYENDNNLTYSIKTHAKMKDKDRLNSRVIQWQNYLKQIDEIQIFLPHEGKRLLANQVKNEEYKFLNNQIMQQIKTTNERTEIIFIRIKNILILEKFRGAGGENPSEIYENLPNEFYQILKSNNLNMVELKNYKEYKIYEIKHGFLWQTEATKLLNEKYSIKADNMNKLRRYLKDDNSFDAIADQPYHLSLKFLKENKDEIRGKTNIINCTKI